MKEGLLSVARCRLTSEEHTESRSGLKESPRQRARTPQAEFHPFHLSCLISGRLFPGGEALCALLPLGICIPLFLLALDFGYFVAELREGPGQQAHVQAGTQRPRKGSSPWHNSSVNFPLCFFYETFLVFMV